MKNAQAIWVKLDTTGSLQIKYFFSKLNPRMYNQEQRLVWAFMLHLQSTVRTYCQLLHIRQKICFSYLCPVYIVLPNRGTKNPIPCILTIQCQTRLRILFNMSIQCICRACILSLLSMVCSSFYHPCMRCSCTFEFDGCLFYH